MPSPYWPPARVAKTEMTPSASLGSPEGARRTSRQPIPPLTSSPWQGRPLGPSHSQPTPHQRVCSGLVALGNHERRPLKNCAQVRIRPLCKYFRLLTDEVQQACDFVGGR